MSAVCGALRFLYQVTLKREWVGTGIPLPKIPFKLPVILSPEEVMHFLECVRGRMMPTLLTTTYAAGLRVSEVAHLKLTDISARVPHRPSPLRHQEADHGAFAAPRLRHALAGSRH